jgi:hypothetical protein
MLLSKRNGRSRVAVCLLAMALCLLAAWPTGASAATTLPPEGIFDHCQLDTQMSTCLQRLQTIHSGGFQVVVINAYSASLPSLQTYATAAQGLGMKVMWAISSNGWWSSPLSSTSLDAGGWIPFATACGCTENGQILSYLVHWLAALPATYGYYAADDSMLSPGDQTGVSQYMATIKASDPVHPTIISSNDESQTAQYESLGNMSAPELYPITTSTLMPVSNNQVWWDAESQEATYDQGLANRAGKPSAFILQAFSFGDNLSDGEAVGACTPSMSQLQCWSQLRYPSPADQLKLRNEVLKHAHPKIILWWSFPGTYGQTGGDTYSTYPTGSAAAAHWTGLVSAINAPAPGLKLSHSRRAKKHHHRGHHRRHHRHHHRRHRSRRYRLRHPRRLV